MDIIKGERAVNKIVKCRKCSFTNDEAEQKFPEVIVIRKRPHNGQNN